MDFSTLYNAAHAYKDHYGSYYWDRDHFEGAFVGEFDYHADVRDFLLDDWFETFEVPDHLAGYIDEDAVIRDLEIESFNIVEYNRKFYVFRIY